MKSVGAEGVRVVVLPPLDPRVADAVAPAWWPLERLGEGIEVLARRAGLEPRSADDLDPVPSNALRSAEFERWLTWACERLGVEAEPIDATVPDLGALLDGAGPAIVPHIEGRGRGFFLLLERRRAHALLVAPDRTVCRCRTAALRTALCWRFEAPLAPEIDALLDAADVPRARRAQARAGLLAERLAADRSGRSGCCGCRRRRRSAGSSRAHDYRRSSRRCSRCSRSATSPRSSDGA